MTRSAYTVRPATARIGDRRSLFQKQRSALITLAYSAVKAGSLDLTETAVERFCEDNWTAPVVSDYDAGMNGVKPRGALTTTQADDLVQGVVRHVLTRYSPEYFSAVQAARGRANKKFTVKALLALPPGLSIPQQAEALGCSTDTVSRLRREAKSMEADKPRTLTLEELAATSGPNRTSAVQHETLTSENAPGTSADSTTLTYEDYKALDYATRWNLLMAGNAPEPEPEYDATDPFGLLLGIDLEMAS